MPLSESLGSAVVGGAMGRSFTASGSWNGLRYRDKSWRVRERGAGLGSGTGFRSAARSASVCGRYGRADGGRWVLAHRKGTRTRLCGHLACRLNCASMPFEYFQLGV